MTKQQVTAQIRLAAVIAAMQLRGPSSAISLPAAVVGIGLIKTPAK